MSSSRFIVSCVVCNAGWLDSVSASSDLSGSVYTASCSPPPIQTWHSLEYQSSRKMYVCPYLVLGVAQLFVLSVLFFVVMAEMWQDHSNCGYQRVPLKPEALIVGGELAQDGEYPWIASLQEFDHHICGATLIAPNLLLTAAHCIEVLNDASIYSALMGTNNVYDHPETAQAATAEEIFLHPNYDREFTDFDIAVIRLQTPMNLTDYVTTACLPTRDMKSVFERERTVTMSGWGTLYQGGRLTDQLREVSVPLVNLTQCREEYKPFPITDNMICTGPKEGGKDSCQGDSGGPTVTKEGDRWWLVGVIIGGVGCAVPGFRGVSSSTIAFQDWIQPIFEGRDPTRKVVTCKEGEFPCQGGWCVPYYAKCDGFPDCRMETDELYCDGVLKLFDPFFYRRVSNKSATRAVPASDLHRCAKQCLDAGAECGVFEFYMDDSDLETGDNETEPSYKCVIAEAGEDMIAVSVAEARASHLIQFVRKVNISVGDNPVYVSSTDVILSPSYLTAVSTNMLSSSAQTWTIRLSELSFNTLVFKVLAIRGKVDCGSWSTFALLSINGAANTTSRSGSVGISRCLSGFAPDEVFHVSSPVTVITYYASDMQNLGFMLEYDAEWRCDEKFTAAPGSLSSPRFHMPNHLYPPNILCRYAIDAPADKRVALEIASYIIEPDMEEGACDFDSLSVFDGNDTRSPRLEYLCGFGTGPVSVLSESSSLYIVFLTDESGQYPGFAASFSFVDPPTNDSHADVEFSSTSGWTSTTRPPTTQPTSISAEATATPRPLPLSPRARIQSVFKVALTTVLITFIIIAIVFAILYCRLRRENAKLKENLSLYQNGKMISL
ncbi:uncharacterized protein [Diadema antillarum]|uniref:uncharacterized protein n=1 Tax=Diadema antillarum TaxID=105358 RepID=UPI003A8B1862